ncbi:hypothetical protein ADK59_21445 [Streptomyces sp. XY332]|nr:hypothetical protein ADK59_21445 [Streptomyces sp. XY332]
MKQGSDRERGHATSSGGGSALQRLERQLARFRTPDQQLTIQDQPRRELSTAVTELELVVSCR